MTKVKDHGRLEKRDYRLLNDLSWLPQQAEWDGLQAVGMVTATISRGNETTTDARYWVNPKFCVNSIWGANRAKFIQGGSRGIRLLPC